MTGFRTRMALVALICLAGASALRGAELRLTAPVADANGVVLEWNQLGADEAYTIQFRESVAGAPWLAAPSPFPWPVATNRWLDTQPSAGARFYRALAVQRAERGKLISATPLGTYSKATLSFLFGLGGIPVTPQFDVAAYKLLYETTSAWGDRTTASGVIVHPQITGVRWPLASYQHGTLAKKSEAPSANGTGERVLGLAFASGGYVAVLPDYLGLGDSPGVQTYHHARSEGTAGVDMLRAARALCATKSVELNGQLFLVGYSHGGHATMSLLRELESFHTNEFTVTAAAPMAGAYDLSGVTTDDFLSPRPKPNPYYSAMLLASVQEVYRLAPSLADLFTAPYNQTLPPMLTGQNTGDEINNAMKDVQGDPTKALKPEFLAAVRANANHPLRIALRDNDVFRWTPRAPLRLYHCRGDQDVPFANSEVALAAFQAAGAANTTQLIDKDPSAGHGACSEPSLLDAKAWFDSLRQ